MPSHSSRGPNMSPDGTPGVIMVDTSPRWIFAYSAFIRAFDRGAIGYEDWYFGTYPPDLESILAFEV